MDTSEELLQALKVGFALELDQLGSANRARVVPTLGKHGGGFRDVIRAQQFQACLRDEPLVFSGRKEEVLADRAARRDLLV